MKRYVLSHQNIVALALGAVGVFTLFIGRSVHNGYTQSVLANAGVSALSISAAIWIVNLYFDFRKHEEDAHAIIKAIHPLIHGYLQLLIESGNVSLGVDRFADLLRRATETYSPDVFSDDELEEVQRIIILQFDGWSTLFVRFGLLLDEVRPLLQWSTDSETVVEIVLCKLLLDRILIERPTLETPPSRRRCLDYFVLGIKGLRILNKIGDQTEFSSMTRRDFSNIGIELRMLPRRFH